MNRAAFAIASCIAAGAACFQARAGVIIDTGTITLWNGTYGYSMWSILSDPVKYDGGSAPHANVSELAFYGGRLYVAHFGQMSTSGPLAYDTGASGDLSTPISYKVDFSGGQPGAIDENANIAINTSGAGLGAFTGPAPTLVVGCIDANFFTEYSRTLTPATSTTPPALIPGPKRAMLTYTNGLAYMSSIDRFVFSNAGSMVDSVITIGKHSAENGIYATQPMFTLPVYWVSGLEVISSPFASRLVGMPVSDPQVLLILTTNSSGNPATLAVYTIAGQQLGETIPLWMFVGTGSTQVWGVTADEAAGNIYIGENRQGRLAVINLGCPSDFDHSGFVDTDDFDAFVHAFEAGTDDADFDHSGFVDTDDFDAFVHAFDSGC